jgi:hypothetical protein
MSEQISGIRDNNREESVRSAMEDIALIRRLIDHTEINMHRLGWLFLVYGLVFLVYSLIEAFSTAVVAHTATLETTANVSVALSLLTYVVIAVLFGIVVIDDVEEIFLRIVTKKGEHEVSDSLIVIKDNHDFVSFLGDFTIDDIVLRKEIIRTVERLREGTSVRLNHGRIGRVVGFGKLGI